MMNLGIFVDFFFLLLHFFMIIFYGYIIGRVMSNKVNSGRHLEFFDYFFLLFFLSMSSVLWLATASYW